MTVHELLDFHYGPDGDASLRAPRVATRDTPTPRGEAERQDRYVALARLLRDSGPQVAALLRAEN